MARAFEKRLKALELPASAAASAEIVIYGATGEPLSPIVHGAKVQIWIPDNNRQFADLETREGTL